MAKTEVILTNNVIGLGAESDHVKVAAGYARNYLFPQGLAIPLTAANKRRLEALRQRRAEREGHEFNTMSELAKGLSKMLLVVTAKAGEEGKMFGSITPGIIADELKHQFDVIDRASDFNNYEMLVLPDVIDADDFDGHGLTTLPVEVGSARGGCIRRNPASPRTRRAPRTACGRPARRARARSAATKAMSRARARCMEP